MTATSTSGGDAAPTESPEGLVLFFDGAPGAGGPNRLHRVTRATTGTPYGMANAIPAFSGGVTSYEDRFPYLVGTTLYFASRAASATDRRTLFSAPTNASGISGMPTPVPGIDLTKDNNAPVVSLDEKTIYFARSGAETHVFVATRGASNTDFGPATKLPNINVKDVVVPTALSADGCELYFHTVATGERQMPYVARRPKP